MFVAVGAWLIGTAEHYTTSVDRPIVQIGRWGQTSEGVVHRDQAVDADVVLQECVGDNVGLGA